MRKGEYQAMTPSLPDDFWDVPSGGDQPKGLWNSAQPSAKVVQHHYVSARCHEINRQEQLLRQKTIDALKDDHTIRGRAAALPKSKRRQYVEDIYDKLTSALQSCPLTINFKANDWFDHENDESSYKQMYERAVKSGSGRMELSNTNGGNALERAAADDRVTFPDHWNRPGAHLTRHRRGGVLLGNQPTQNIMSRMMTGLQTVGRRSDKNYDGYMSETATGSNSYLSKNAKFNPATKQIFGALNYGGRPHGSSTYYGGDYFVLSPKLKVDAIYFAGDTFGTESAYEQVTYQTLAAIYLRCDERGKHILKSELISTCLDGMHLRDTTLPECLIEAHLFTELRFAGNFIEMHVRPTPYADNVRKFAKKWGIKIFWTSPCVDG
jgi:hypothetical protein